MHLLSFVFYLTTLCFIRSSFCSFVGFYLFLIVGGWLDGWLVIVTVFVLSLELNIIRNRFSIIVTNLFPAIVTFITFGVVIHLAALVFVIFVMAFKDRKLTNVHLYSKDRRF
ncbi:hypothetical protein BDF20DRAFT_886549 [Mycotypha africana]|uniref:uncharacterized protein n=1 Tax=Mycotypha africana TaxID=64632 RepID=UPI0023014A9B|nr:uncharacterized protein BDF20DRAFT_886549 [Mycotypha africana]KAI8971807.1 hypothetical protein BDF20DRAFT_886549 [Mycotypha africana]